MTQTTQIAKHLKDVHFGGNWTWSNLKDNVADVSWQEATTKIGSFNTIAALVFHTNYFVAAVLDVLQGRPLTSHDKFSFDVQPITSQEDWEKLVNKALTEAELCSTLIAQLPDSKLNEVFVEEKYGNYFRNFHGLIEHTHYHLGQIAILKKLIKEK